MSEVSHCDIAVIGAGPAGLAAAGEAAQSGMRVVLLDEQTTPGGQIYRAITTTPVRDRTIMGPDYWCGELLAASIERSGARILPGAMVWSITPTGEIAFSIDGKARLLTARHAIIATGALERPFPIPGWTLPGVMTAGAAQIALKSSGLVAEGKVVLAGTGPLLYLLAAQYLRAGAKITALLDTTPRDNYARALRHAVPFVFGGPYFAKGIGLLYGVYRRINVITGVTVLAASGGERLRRVDYRVGRRSAGLEADVLLLHQGVTPNVNLAWSAGCAHRWDDEQLCFRPETDAFGRSSVPCLSIAGDGAGIVGALGAEPAGRLAALGAMNALGRLDADALARAAAPYRAALAHARRGRAFLDALYRPPRWSRVPDGRTIVCRCEEVTAQQIRDAVAVGCTGPNQMKTYLRCGMGPCQGRLCALTVTELIAEARGVPPQEVGHYRLRAPVKPVTLGELAALPADEAAIEAVENR